MTSNTECNILCTLQTGQVNVAPRFELLAILTDIFVVLLSYSTRILLYYLQIVHNHLLPNTYLLSIRR